MSKRFLTKNGAHILPAARILNKITTIFVYKVSSSFVRVSCLALADFGHGSLFLYTNFTSSQQHNDEWDVQPCR